MRDLEIGRVVRALRRRRGWRQDDAALRGGVHRSTWSLVERGRLDRMTLSTLRRCLAAIDVRLDLLARWRGSDLDRLLDEGHSRLQAAWKARLERWGWEVIAEASFNHYGDRGRIDLLAWHSAATILLVVEIKTVVADAQDLLGALDVKVRVARSVALERGWPRVLAVVPVLLVAETSTNRDRIARLGSLFGQFAPRGRVAMTWMRRPMGAHASAARPSGARSSGARSSGAQNAGIPRGLLIFSDSRSATTSRVTRVGRDRVRRREGVASSGAAAADRTRGD